MCRISFCLPPHTVKYTRWSYERSVGLWEKAVFQQALLQYTAEYDNDGEKQSHERSSEKECRLSAAESIKLCCGVTSEFQSSVIWQKRVTTHPWSLARVTWEGHKSVLCSWGPKLVRFISRKKRGLLWSKGGRYENKLHTITTYAELALHIVNSAKQISRMAYRCFIYNQLSCTN